MAFHPESFCDFISVRSSSLAYASLSPASFDRVLAADQGMSPCHSYLVDSSKEVYF